jgi:hypothetical protein
VGFHDTIIQSISKFILNQGISFHTDKKLVLKPWKIKNALLIYRPNPYLNVNVVFRAFDKLDIGIHDGAFCGFDARRPLTAASGDLKTKRCNRH